MTAKNRDRCCDCQLETIQFMNTIMVGMQEGHQ